MKKTRRALSLLLVLALTLGLFAGLTVTASAIDEVRIAVTISDPVVGDTPDFNPRLDYGNIYVDSLKSVKWYYWNPTGGIEHKGLYDPMTSDMTFERNVKYIVQVEFNMKSGYKIKPGSTINGISANDGGQYYILKLEDFYADERINRVDFQLSTPSAGMTPEDISKSISCATPNVKVDTISITDAADDPYVSNYALQSGDEVFVYVDVTVDKGYGFPKDSKNLESYFGVPGTSPDYQPGQEAYSEKNNQEARLYMRYTVENKPLDMVSITGLPKPEPGGKAEDCKADLKVPSGAHYSVWGMEWGMLRDGSEEKIPFDTVFEAGKTYLAVILVEPEAGYKIAEDVTVVVNEGSVTVPKVERDGDDIILFAEQVCGETVTVSFDANGGTGTRSPETVPKGVPYNLPPCEFIAPEGKEFDNWDRGTPGEDIILDSDITLKAIWKDKAAARIMPFTDVKESDWFYDDVKIAYETYLIDGYTDTTYEPNKNLTYAQAVKLAACMHQKYTTGSVTLENAEKGKPWYETYVDYAKANKIISKDYEWNKAATRAGYIEIFANALPDAAFAEKNTVANNAIPDVKMGHPQAAAIYKLYRAGILEGSDGFKCKPNDNIRRSEVAAILTRMMNASTRKSFSLT